jgi:hypothetical protein
MKFTYGACRNGNRFKKTMKLDATADAKRGLSRIAGVFQAIGHEYEAMTFESMANAMVSIHPKAIVHGEGLECDICSEKSHITQ